MPPGSGLDSTVRNHPGCARIGVGFVVLVRHSLRRADGQQQNVSCGQRVGAACLVHGGGGETFIRGKGLGELLRGGAYRQHIRGPVAEGDSQPHGQDDGKDEDPEDCLGLADEQEKPDNRQLVEAVELELIHRADSFP